MEFDVVPIQSFGRAPHAWAVERGGERYSRHDDQVSAWQHCYALGMLTEEQIRASRDMALAHMGERHAA
jgi:hypothetical protein